MRNSFVAVPLAAALLMLPARAVHAQAPAPETSSPQYQSKGEQDRTYLFPGTEERIAYHIYVPAKWTPATMKPRASAIFASVGLSIGR